MSSPNKTSKPVVHFQTQSRQEFIDSCAKKTVDYNFICRVCKQDGVMYAGEIDYLTHSFESKGSVFQLPTKHKNCKKVYVENYAEKKNAPAREKIHTIFTAFNEDRKVAVKVPAKSKELLELEAELEILKKEAEIREREAPLIAAAKAEIAKLKEAAKAHNSE